MNEPGAAFYNVPMNGTRTFTFLGCGTSVGVPMIGCDCAVCTSTNPRNHRYRPSVFIHAPAGNILIDTTPELRLQLVREKIKLVNAVVYTHFHADHLYGLDDARVLTWALGGPMPLYCTAETEEVIRQAFFYAFDPSNDDVSPQFVPKLTFERITAEPFEVCGERFTPVPLEHGRFDVFGFRIGNIAYCTDLNAIPDGSWRLLESLDVLVIDALRPGRPHRSHFCLEQALEAIERLRPKQAYLTHMNHEMDYDALVRRLPQHVAPAYDGLSFRF